MARLGATFQGQNTDRPALLLNASLYGARLTGAALADHYTRAATYVAGQRAVQERFQTDFLLTPFYAAALGAAWGSELAFGDRGVPVLKRYAALDIGQLLKLPEPDINAHPAMIYLQETAQGLSLFAKGQIPVVGVMVSPVDLPALIMGSEAWLDALLFEPELALEALKRSERFCLALGRAFLDQGAMALCMTCNFVNPGMLPWRKAKSWLDDFLKGACQAFNCPIVLHHGGFTFQAAVREGEFLFKDMANVVGFCLDSRDDAQLLRQHMGPGPLLFGNIEGSLLERVDVKGVDKLVRHWFGKMGTDPRAVFATSGPDIPLSTPPENLDALRDALQQVARHG